MGKRPAELEYELERQRHALSYRTTRLQDRVAGDLESLKDAAADRAADLSDKARGMRGKVMGRAREPGEEVSERADGAGEKALVLNEHPAATLFGALGAGFLAGLATGGEEDGGRRRSGPVPAARVHTKAPPPAEPKDSGGGRPIARVKQAAVSFIEAEASTIARDFMDGVRGRESRPQKTERERLADAAAGAVPAPIRSAWQSVASRLDGELAIEPRAGGREPVAMGGEPPPPRGARGW